MSVNGRNALQTLEILNLGQLLNLATTITKVKISRLVKLHKSLHKGREFKSLMHMALFLILHVLMNGCFHTLLLSHTEFLWI